MYHVKDGVIGLAVGDAMGLPTEKMSRDDLLKKPILKMMPKISAGIPRGSWGSNTSLMLATIDSLYTYGLNYQGMADNYVKWFTNNAFCSINEVIEVENTTLKSLVLYTQHLGEPYDCGSTEYNENNSYVITRCLPLAYYFTAYRDTDKNIYDAVKKTCSITHAHEISVLACYIYVRLVMILLRGNNKYSALNQLKKIDYSMFTKNILDEYKRILVEDITNLEIDDIKNSNNLVDTLEAAIWCFLKAESFKECVIATTNIGGNTNTIGSIAGSFAGIFYGFSNIPKNYLDDLRKTDYLLEMCDNFETYLKKI